MNILLCLFLALSLAVGIYVQKKCLWIKLRYGKFDIIYPEERKQHNGETIESQRYELSVTILGKDHVVYNIIMLCIMATATCEAAAC